MPSNNTPGGYNYTIPQTVGEVEVEIHGARGGEGGPRKTAYGGYGGYIKGRYSVSENSTQSLFIAVGGKGGNDNGSGGSSPLDSGNGGDGGSSFTGSFGGTYQAGGGGGGGGESGVKVNNSLIAASGGGGGGGGGSKYNGYDEKAAGGDGGRGGGRSYIQNIPPDDDNNQTGGNGGEKGYPFGHPEQSTNSDYYGDNGNSGDVTLISSFNILDEQRGGSDYENGYVEVNYAPEAPTSINVTNNGRDISISWANAQNQNGYKLFRDGNKVYQANSTSYSESVTPDNTYTYTVSAYNEYGESQYNTSDSVTIEPTIVNRIEDNNNDYPRIISAKKWNGSNWTDTKTYQSNGNDWYR